LEQCRSCRYQASLTAGTIFHRTRKPLDGAERGRRHIGRPSNAPLRKLVDELLGQETELMSLEIRRQREWTGQTPV
jgi:hypothetical protein